MTHKNRFNILISRIMMDAQTPDGPFTGVVVVVRYGYVPADDRDANGRSLYVTLPMGEMWDPDAINNLHQPGAFRVDVDVPAIDAAVASLRAAWGDIPVQDNSGRCAHLATAPGILVI
jgi:hypothetical protein